METADGWVIHYTKFLVTFHGIKVADGAGVIAAEMKDHLYYDDLQAKDAQVRFGNIAAADADNDAALSPTIGHYRGEGECFASAQ